MRTSVQNTRYDIGGKGARQTRGFTLIELMVVVAVISILAMIAMPAYLDYAIRAQISEGLEMFAPVKKGVTEAYAANGGQWPSSNRAAGLPLSTSYQTKYVESISVAASGAVVVTFSIPDLGADNNTIIYVPIDKQGGIDWECTLGTVLPRFRPPVCRSGGA